MTKQQTASTYRPKIRRLKLRSLIMSALALTLGLYACASATPQANQSASPTATTATESSASSEPAVYTESGIAISGADPVAYFNDSAFVEGSADYTYDWQGVTWQFANTENKDLFASNPEAYAPQYGGYCAWAVGAKKALVPTDPNAWKVVDGKLYLNANEKVQTAWVKDIPGNIALADTNWPELSTQ
ncbi:MAG: YHS domain-containing (seleno)protein [Phormidesmis sp.]